MTDSVCPGLLQERLFVREVPILRTTRAVSDTRKNIASNRKAFHDYEVLERVEAGIQLQGTESKSARAGHVTLTGGYARIEGGEAWLYGARIAPYEFGNRFNHDPERNRRLLLHRKQIDRLQVQIDQKGCALIPLSAYYHRGFVKVELGLCKGKRMGDKRETLRRKTVERETERELARRR